MPRFSMIAFAILSSVSLAAIESSPIYAGETLFIVGRKSVFAIGK